VQSGKATGIITAMTDEERKRHQQAEEKLRKWLHGHWEYLVEHDQGNEASLRNSKASSMKRIVDAVARNEISPLVAESMKVFVAKWTWGNDEIVEQPSSAETKMPTGR
jgi:hypothetical protein